MLPVYEKDLLDVIDERIAADRDVCPSPGEIRPHLEPEVGRARQPELIGPTVSQLLDRAPVS